MTLLKEDKEVTMVDNINFSPEFKEKRERWMDARGRANPIDEGLKNIFKKSIEKGNGIMNKMFIDSFMFPPKLSQQF